MKPETRDFNRKNGRPISANTSLVSLPSRYRPLSASDSSTRIRRSHKIGLPVIPSGLRRSVAHEDGCSSAEVIFARVEENFRVAYRNRLLPGLIHIMCCHEIDTSLCISSVESSHSNSFFYYVKCRSGSKYCFALRDQALVHIPQSMTQTRMTHQGLLLAFPLYSLLAALTEKAV